MYILVYQCGRKGYRARCKTGMEFLPLVFVTFVGAELLVFHTDNAREANRFVPPGINGNISCERGVVWASALAKKSKPRTPTMRIILVAFAI
jgi:hypothetical protein